MEVGKAYSGKGAGSGIKQLGNFDKVSFES